MGFFRDTFTRGDKKDYLLNHDDAAFNYFIFVVLLCIFLPFLYLVIKRIVKKLLGWTDIPLKYRCPCPNCQSIKEKHRKTIASSWFTFGFVIQVLIVIGAAYALSRVATEMGKEQKDIKKFDPYEILGIPLNATDHDVKVAYRKLATVLHPDKNPDDPEAAAKFILLNKAYRALSDEEGRRNFLRYGNPEGPGALTIGIALPEFLIKKENNILVLSVFFFVLLVLIPGGGMWWYSTVSKYNKHGILDENIKRYGPLLNENLPLKKISFVMGTTVEFEENISISENEAPTLQRLLTQTSTEKPKNLKPKIMKAQLLINAYMQNALIEDPKLLRDQDYILLIAPRILSYIIELSMEYSIQWKLIALRILKFSQLFFQGLDYGDSHYLQLPFMTKDILKKLQKKSRNTNKPFRDYISLPKDQLGLNETFTPEETKIIETTIDAMPRLGLEVKCYVKGSDKIYQGDLVTIDVTATRKYGSSEKQEENVPTGIHSNKYTYPKQEIIWIVVCSKQAHHIFHFTKLHRPFTTVHKEYQFLVEHVFY